MRLEARYRKGKLIIGVIGASLFVMCGMVLLFSSPVFSQWSFGGLALIGGFGGYLFVMAPRLVDSKPVIVIDEKGMLDRRLLDRPVPWKAVASYAESRAKELPIVIFTLYQGGAYTDSIAKKAAIAANKALGYGDMMLTSNGVTTSHEDILAAVRHHLEARRVRQRTPLGR